MENLHCQKLEEKHFIKRYFQSQKWIVLHILILSFLFVCGQNKKSENNSIDTESEFSENNLVDNTISKFSLTIDKCNHATLLFEGYLIYNLTDSILSISREFTILGNDTVLLLTKTIDRNSIYKIQNIRIDSLEDFYFNRCILPTSGNRYNVSTIINDTIKKTIHLHHYYEEHIEMITSELDKHIPDDLKINYLTRETKQDCE